jgi:hypothetical protein
MHHDTGQWDELDLQRKTTLLYHPLLSLGVQSRQASPLGSISVYDHGEKEESALQNLLSSTVL